MTSKAFRVLFLLLLSVLLFLGESIPAVEAAASLSVTSISVTAQQIPPVLLQARQRKQAQPNPSRMPSPTEILSRLFTATELQRAWFADSFLAQISLGEISQITQGIVGTLGNYQSIEDVDKGFVLTFERGNCSHPSSAQQSGTNHWSTL